MLKYNLMLSAGIEIFMYENHNILRRLSYKIREYYKISII